MASTPEDQKDPAQVRLEDNLPARSKRAARACARCHSRKVRCDGSITGFPCTNCRLDGRPCTLHSGKREKEKQLLRVLGKDRRRASYPTPMTPPEVLAPASRQSPILRVRLADPAKVTFIKSQGTLRVPIQDVLDIFTKHYFLYVHPCLPVIDEAAFWKKYRCPDGSSGRISVLLFQAMLFAASPYVPLKAAQQCGYDSLISARDDLYQRAKRIYESGIEKDRLIVAQSCVILSYYTTDAVRSTNSKWLKIAIKYAKKERANFYYSGPSQTGRKTSDLKRLWWCCLIRDRVISLGVRRPIQILPDDFDLQQPGLSYEDLEEESHNSEVYHSDTKVALCRVLASLCHLVVAVTDLVMLVYPTTQTIPFTRKDRQMELDRLEGTKIALLNWELNWMTYPEGKEYYSHQSLALYTNLIGIYYQSARIALCNRICLLIGNAPTDSLDDTEFERIESCRSGLASAIRSTADNVKQLILNGVADKLPISAIAYTMFPQILLSVQSQLSTTPEDKQNHEVMLVFFVEIFRCFRSQYYTQLILAVTWKALELCQHHSSGSSTALVTSSATGRSKSYMDNLFSESSYPSLFQLRLTDYIQLLRYVDEFLSLRRIPTAEVYTDTSGAGFDLLQQYQQYQHQHQHRQQQMSPPTEDTMSMSLDNDESSSTLPTWMESMENFYFGEADLWTGGTSNTFSPEQEQEQEQEAEVETKAHMGGYVGENGTANDVEAFQFDGSSDLQMLDQDIDMGEESFQRMLQCLPLLGE